MSEEAVNTPRPMWRMVLAFLLMVLALQWGWSQARGTAVERAVIDVATVGTAVSLINHWTPDVQAQAVGSRIKAPGGGINILNGCEGTEVLFLLVAALMAYPMSWRWRLIGLLAGTVWVFGLNQVRLMVLFYSYRSNRDLFEQLHGLIAPLALVAASLVFVACLIQLDARYKGKATS